MSNNKNIMQSNSKILLTRTNRENSTEEDQAKPGEEIDTIMSKRVFKPGTSSRFLPGKSFIYLSIGKKTTNFLKNIPVKKDESLLGPFSLVSSLNS